MCQLEAAIAREIGDIVKGALTPFGVRIAALEARVNGLENANAYRDSLAELKNSVAQLQNQMSSLARVSEKAAVVRLTARGGGA